MQITPDDIKNASPELLNALCSVVNSSIDYVNFYNDTHTSKYTNDVNPWIPEDIFESVEYLQTVYERGI
jgi:hypothetical protein